MKNEIILYQADDLTKVEVKLEGESVWLNKEQLSSLFGRDRSVISRHVANIFKEGELQKDMVCAFFAQTTPHGAIKDKTQRMTVEYYNLDVIISVGYRVKSRQGTRFRIWATKVLKEHLLKGYTVNKRMDRVESKVDTLSNKINEIDLQINANLPPNQGIFFDGQIFDAYSLLSDLVRKAKQRIVLIDNYVDDSVLTLFSKKRTDVYCDIFTRNINKQLQQDTKIFNLQYGKLTLHKFNKAHDRFLIIDHDYGTEHSRTEVYHIGASLKDLGKKWFAFTKLDKNTVRQLLSFVSEML